MRPEDKEYVKEIIDKHGYQSPILDTCVGTISSPYEDEDLFSKGSYFRHDIAQFHNSIDVICDICEMDQIPDHTFGTIINFWALEHIYNPFKAISEMYRILREDGMLLLAVPLHWRVHRAPAVKDYWRFCPDGLRLLLTSFIILDLRVDGCKDEFEWDQTAIDYRSWHTGSTGIYIAAKKTKIAQK